MTDIAAGGLRIALCLGLVSSAARAAGEDATVGLLQTGKYAEARTGCEKSLAASPADLDLKATYAQVLFESGAWDKVLELAAAAAEPRLDALAGEVQWRRGRFDEAVTQLARSKEDRWCQALTGLVHVARGKKTEAAGTFTAIRDALNLEAKKASDLWALSVAHRELGSFQASLDALSRAQELFPEDMRTRVMIADLFVTKYQVNDAMKEIESALEKNPNHPFALCAKADVESEYGRNEEARETAQKAQAACPPLVEPRLVRARLFEYEESYDKMLAAIEEARALNPGSAAVLTRVAVARWLRSEKSEYAAAEKACLAVKPGHARLYLELGEATGHLRHVSEAEGFYKQALAMDPELSEADSALGNLYMREGLEELARVHLERAWAADNFNYRTKNFLELLDYMDRKFMVRLSDQFVFKVDEEKEGYLADVFLPEMDRMYPDLLKRYKFSPRERVIVELFPANDWFAARISGTPWIGITGGCFGRVIAAESPAVQPGTSHRSEVLLHEITHAINLQQTDRRIPMWFAEGLAVQQERGQGAPSWPALLKRSLGVGDLLPLSNLNSGFTRAKNMAQRQLAYYQASLMVADLKARYGFDKVLELLEKFHEGKNHAQAFQAVIRLDAAALDAQAMSVWKTAAEASPRRAVYGESDLEELRKRAAAGGPAEQAELLVGLMGTGHAVEAVPIVKQLATPAKSDARLAALIGDFLRSRKAEDKALNYYKLAVSIDPKSYGGLMGLAALSGSTPKEAAAHLSAAAAAFPRESAPHVELRKIYQSFKDSAGELAEIRELARLDLHSSEPWTALALALIERKDWKGAREALTELVSIDTTNPALHGMRATVAEALGEKDAALDAWTLHFRLQAAPYKPGSKAGDGLDLLKAAKRGDGSLKELGAIAAAGPIGTKESGDWLSELAVGSGETAHRAALALGGKLDARAVPGLIAALSCTGPGACGEKALQTLRRVTGRGFDKREEWQGWHRSRANRPREDWALESLEAAGFKAAWGEAGEEVPVLLKALEAKEWWVRELAWHELGKSAKFAYGRGAFGPVPAAREADYAALRKDAVARFRGWWERYKARM